MSFLASELDLEHYGAEIGSLVWNRIRQSKFTTSINPGYLPKGKKGNISAPWEIYSLCHHSRLVVADIDRRKAGAGRKGFQGDGEMEVYRGNLSLFLTTDASLIPCWERNSMTSCQAWLHSEPTAVLASTLLDIYLRDMEASPQKPLGDRKDEKRMKRDRKPGFSPKTPRPVFDSVPSIDWPMFKPPRRYHPPEFAQSLGDTPHKYRKAMMELVRVPNNIRLYLGGETKQFEAAEWDVQRLGKIWADAANISLLDIMALDSANSLKNTPKSLW